MKVRLVANKIDLETVENSEVIKDTWHLALAGNFPKQCEMQPRPNNWYDPHFAGKGRPCRLCKLRTTRQKRISIALRIACSVQVFAESQVGTLLGHRGALSLVPFARADQVR